MMAATTAISIAGSSTFIPPAIFKKTSFVLISNLIFITENQYQVNVS